MTVNKPVLQPQTAMTDFNENQLFSNYVYAQKAQYVAHEPFSAAAGQDLEPTITGYSYANSEGELLFELGAVRADVDTIVISGIHVERIVQRVRPTSDPLVVRRYDTVDRCVLDGGHALKGIGVDFKDDVTCSEVNWHYAPMFRDGSKGCEAMRAAFRDARCHNNRPTIGCCSDGKAAPQCVDVTSAAFHQQKIITQEPEKGFMHPEKPITWIMMVLLLFTLGSGFQIRKTYLKFKDNQKTRDMAEYSGPGGGSCAVVEESNVVCCF